MNKYISDFQYITQDMIDKSHHELAMATCIAGIDWVQLRVKNKSYAEWLDIALKTQMICRKYHAKFIVNDNVKIAKEAKADGVHLGKSDRSPAEARQILGTNAIIGGTANTFGDIKQLVNEGVDYIGLGPFRFTTTKENLSPVLGLTGYESIIKKCRKNGITIPIIAIGGIKTEDVKSVMETGVYGIAVSSAINKSTAISETVKRFQDNLKQEEKLKT